MYVTIAMVVLVCLAVLVWVWATAPGPFPFQQECRDLGGSLMWHASNDAQSPNGGVLLACRRIVASRDVSGNTLLSELEDIRAKIANGTYAPQTEADRLRLYFQLVYPEAWPHTWANLTEGELVQKYQDLELFYNLPAEIAPRTPKHIGRRGPPLYRVPAGVVLDQAGNRKMAAGAYVEVVRFGAANVPYSNPADFTGTYYYPAKGSGVYLPLGNTLVAYNKVSALTQLGVTPVDLLPHTGLAFHYFLSEDSDALWESIKARTPRAQREDYWRTLGGVEYIPAALNAMVAEMASGKSMRKVTLGGMTFVSYYGLGDAGDAFLAKLARNRGYDSIQLLREAQKGRRGAVVATELLHLYEPVVSQSMLVRLDPTAAPPHGAGAGPPYNLQLRNQGKVTVDVVATNANFRPHENKVVIDTLVAER